MWCRTALCGTPRSPYGVHVACIRYARAQGARRRRRPGPVWQPSHRVKGMRTRCENPEGRRNGLPHLARTPGRAAIARPLAPEPHCRHVARFPLGRERVISYIFRVSLFLTRPYTIIPTVDNPETLQYEDLPQDEPGRGPGSRVPPCLQRRRHLRQQLDQLVLGPVYGHVVGEVVRQR